MKSKVNSLYGSRVGNAWLPLVLLVVASLIPVAAAMAQVTPPDLTVCDGIDKCDAATSGCNGGFRVTLQEYVPAPSQNSGTASYVYTICEPALGVCVGGTGLRAGQACSGNTFCRSQGQQQDPEATCNRDCAVDDFRGLSHSDLMFPPLVGTCLTEDTAVSVSCTSPARGNYSGVIGDGSCFEASSPVAKCDDPQLSPGQCLTMTVAITGELNSPGLGTAVLVDKPANVCVASCMAGPSCDACVGPPEGEQCLTRTIGFWGNHPWITNDYAPVTVCGATLGCYGASDGKSNPSCPAGSCDSIVEGLCSIGGEDRNAPYIAMVRQLTAAKLNLNATASLFGGASCSDWSYQGKSIQQWITSCESLCDATKSVISRSGCIEALDAFNNSEDGGLTTTPAPFDHPAVDDFGNTSGADPSQCGAAQGNGDDPVLVIGKRADRRNPASDCR